MLEFTTNWHLLDGNLQNVIDLSHCDEKSSELPEFPTDIVDDARTIVLERPEDGEDENQCSLTIRSANNLIKSVSFAVSYCKRAEIFSGISFTYRETVDGAVYSEINELDVYRYDIRFDKGESFITVKLIPRESPIVIFGVHVKILERPWKPASFLPGVDMSNLSELLNLSSLNPSEESQKLKSSLASKLMVQAMSSNAAKSSSSVHNLPTQSNTLAEGDIKEFLEQRLKKLEENITRQIDEKLEMLEKRQNERLSEILNEIHCLKLSK
ncbi:uncharacterized protein LOC132257517 [Phlebotomus argentipes]|uniref:uncharacterized protein LOC132257517 n=1 Tax=Phlebotomus argentipes TaxID=94469 RepID=UPI002892A101|nr:uncharacterized protein LOC132257517 [Phlebotomus argentipes]